MVCYRIQFLDPPALHWVRSSSPPGGGGSRRRRGTNDVAARTYHSGGGFLWSTCLSTILAGIHDDKSPLNCLRGMEDVLLCGRILSYAGFPKRVRCDCCRNNNNHNNNNTKENDSSTTSNMVTYSYRGHELYLDDFSRIRANMEKYNKFPFFEEDEKGNFALSCPVTVTYNDYMYKKETAQGRRMMEALFSMGKSLCTCDSGTSGGGSGGSLLTITEAGLSYDHYYGEMFLSWEDLDEYECTVLASDSGSRKKLVLEKLGTRRGFRSYSDEEGKGVGIPCRLTERKKLVFDTALADEISQIIVQRKAARKDHSTKKPPTETS